MSHSWHHLGVRLREESWPPLILRISYGSGEAFGISMEGLPEGPVVNSEPELPKLGPGFDHTRGLGN